MPSLHHRNVALRTVIVRQKILKNLQTLKILIGDCTISPNQMIPGVLINLPRYRQAVDSLKFLDRA